MSKLKLQKPKIVQTVRKDHVLRLIQKYSGDINTNPKTYNKAFAEVLRGIANALEKIDNYWADPQLTVWMQFGSPTDDEIVAELPMCGPVKKVKKKPEDY